MTEFEKKLNHVSEGLSRLVTQFKNKPNLLKFLTVFLRQIQDLEDMFYGMYLSRWLDNAVGVQLDGIGSIVGESRDSRDDPEYKIAIRARILLNLGEATPEDVLEIINVTLSELYTLRLREFYPAAFSIELQEHIDDLVVDIQLIANILYLAKGAGIMAHLWAHPEGEFRYDTPGQGFDEGKYGGAW